MAREESIIVSSMSKSIVCIVASPFINRIAKWDRESQGKVEWEVVEKNFLKKF